MRITRDKIGEVGIVILMKTLKIMLGSPNHISKEMEFHSSFIADI